MYRIASSVEHVLDNIVGFASEIEQNSELQGRLAYARSWYAYQDENDHWCLGPSKYVGYQGMDAAGYIESAEHRDGRRTEAQLQEWFTIVDPSSQLHEELSTALFTLLAKYGKTPSRKMRINVLNAVYQEHFGTEQKDSNEIIVDLIVAVAKTLPASHLEKLRAGLRG